MCKSKNESKNFQRTKFVLLFVAVLLLFFVIIAECAVEPQTEYEKPGFKPGQAYDGIIPEEHINLFTGGLTLSQRDIPANNINSFEQFFPLVTRTYNSKITRQTIDQNGVCVPTASSVEDDYIGLGWSLHFGRLWDPNPDINSNPVLELPDGSHHMFFKDSFMSGSDSRRISKSLWSLKVSGSNYDACSPGPESVCIRFIDSGSYRDTRGNPSRTVLHAYAWFTFHPSGFSSSAVKMYFNYGLHDTLLRPTSVERPCNAADNIDFTYGGGGGDTLTGIRYKFHGGDKLYSYNIITVDGIKLLDSVQTPEGRKYKYFYATDTKELIRVIISTDTDVPSTPTGTSDSDDVDLRYTYGPQTFYIPNQYLSGACGRVVTSKSAYLSSTNVPTWNYSYEQNDNDQNYEINVQDPNGKSRKVIFQGYSTSAFWKVGQMLSDEIFNGNCCTNRLLKKEWTYDYVTLSNVTDPESYNNQSQVKLPVVLEEKTTLPPEQSGGSDKISRISYGTASNYDRFANPSTKTEKGFDDQTYRTTQFAYAHASDSDFEKKNFIHAVSQVKILDNNGVKKSQIDYTYYNSGTSYGLLMDSRVWNDEATGDNDDLIKAFAYTSDRELSNINEKSPLNTSYRSRDFSYTCGNLTDISNDGFDAKAGPILNMDVDTNMEVYANSTGPNNNATTYMYDDDERLTKVTPPSGDFIQIDYDDDLKKVTVTQGPSETTEEYDKLGRIKKRLLLVQGTERSTQTFIYDGVGNLVQQSEKKFGTPDKFVTKTFDALSRVTRVTNLDGYVDYTYSGPKTDVQINGQASLTTTLKHDAAGRLISVTEPNGGSGTTTYQYNTQDKIIVVNQPNVDDRVFSYSSRGNLTSENQPESGLTTYTYDALGHMLTKKFAGASTITYTYDVRDRLLLADYTDNNQTDLQYFYDGDAVPNFPETYSNPKSHLTGMIDSSGTTTWTQFTDKDEIERRKSYFTGYNALTTIYGYDGRGNLTAIIPPMSGASIGYDHNEANLIKMVDRLSPNPNLPDQIFEIEYNAGLYPRSIDYPPAGNTLNITSDNRNRPDKLSMTGLIILDYRYNSRGLIDQVDTYQQFLNNGTVLRNIDYDRLGRLQTFSDNTGFVTYTYDGVGNLLQKDGSIDLPPLDHNSKNHIVEPGYSYSNSGNLTSIPGGLVFEYDNDNRLTDVVDSPSLHFEYTYDGKGRRVETFDDAAPDDARGKNYFIYDEQGNLLSEISPHLFIANNEAHKELYVDKEYIHGPSGTLGVVRYDQTARGIYSKNVTEASGRRIRLYWKPFQDCRVLGVNIYRATSQNGPYTKMNGDCPNSTYFYDDVSSLVNNQTYYYKLTTQFIDGTETDITRSDLITQIYSDTNENLSGPVLNYASAPTYYNINDHLGTPRIVMRELGTAIGSFEYYPYGEPKFAYGCHASNEGFAGKTFDAESSLQYFDARFLSNNLSRFTSCDPLVASGKSDSPQSWNRYSYTQNSPLNFVDPNGMEEINYYGGTKGENWPNPGQLWLNFGDFASDPAYHQYDNWLGVAALGFGLYASLPNLQLPSFQNPRLPVVNPNATVVFPRGAGAAEGPVPLDFTQVSRWVNPSEAQLWINNEGTFIPNVGSAGRVYVTSFGAPKPPGTGPVRIDFWMQNTALQPAGQNNWFQIFQSVQNSPIYNTVINYFGDK